MDTAREERRHRRAVRRGGWLLLAGLAAVGCRSPVTGPNRPPVADAGGDRRGQVGERIALDGSASFDPDGDEIRFDWQLLAGPVGSAVDFEDTALAQTVMVADRPGDYLVALRVSDGRSASERDVLRVRVAGRACVSNAQCLDDDPCTEDRCLDGWCRNPPLAEGTACDDGRWCTVDETCSGGVCGGGRPRDCPDAEDGCGLGACDEAQDRCRVTSLADGSDCDDGRWCTVGDACQTGVCQGAPRDCSALDGVCQQGVCDEQAEACRAEDLPDGTACDDGLWCNLGETCSGGVCSGGEPRNCADTACSDGVCDEVTDSCDGESLPPGSPCDDELWCTVDDQCDGQGGCAGSPRDCSALDGPCREGICVEQQQACVGDPINEGQPCDDGLWCTVADACQAGGCTGQPRDCSAAAGECQVGVCDDQADACGAEPAADGSGCDDGLWCTVADACQAGGCTGQPRDCSAAAGECQVGVCDDGDDACIAEPADDGTGCDDGQWCTVDEACSSGVCTGGVERDCQPLVGQCEIGSCNEESDSCDATPAPAGQLCPGPDAEPCNSTCDGDSNCQPDIAVADHTPCAGGTGFCCDQVCQTGWTCCQDAECDDGNGCTLDSCQGGSCTNACPDPECLYLEADASAPVGTGIGLHIDTCQGGLDPAALVCFSNRNHQGLLLDEDFATGFGALSTAGDVSRSPAAQSSLFPGDSGALLCGRDAAMTVTLDSGSRQGVRVRFTAENQSLGGGVMLRLDYHNGDQWRALVVLGDERYRPWGIYQPVLPEDAIDGGQIDLRFVVAGDRAAGGECFAIDDLQVMDLLSAQGNDHLLEATFNDGYSPFIEVDPEGDDVRREGVGDNWLAIDDNVDAGIVSGDIDASGVAEDDALILSWDWQEKDGLGNQDYCLVEYSPDSGASWFQLAGTGHHAGPNDPNFYGAQLPCQAAGNADLRLRFICPSSSTCDEGEGVYMDTVDLRAYHLAWIDVFSAWSAEGATGYAGQLDSETAGPVEVICRYGCAAPRWSNAASTAFE